MPGTSTGTPDTAFTVIMATAWPPAIVFRSTITGRIALGHRAGTFTGIQSVCGSADCPIGGAARATRHGVYRAFRAGILYKLWPNGPVAQGIEQQPSKLKVAGSNPAGVANNPRVRSGHMGYGLFRRHR